MTVRDKNHHLVLRGDTWYFVTQVNGKRIKKALSQSITEARRERDKHLRDIDLYGNTRRPERDKDSGILFGEFSQKWSKIIEKKVKISTMRDYRVSMNAHVLPRFGNTPISDIGYLDVEEFISELDCSAKRVNNILVPLRGVFKLAFKSGLIENNVVATIENRTITRPQIKPLSFEEVPRFLENVDPWYGPFFEVAFFTGMRGGEMAALKWENTDLEEKKIRIVETRVYGEEGRPKTDSSYRTINMLPMVHRALLKQATKTRLKSKYVFLNKDDKPVDVSTLRKNAWSEGLKKAKIEYRPMIQTRHTFATLMISAGENLGWVQRMMGHSSLKMIVDKYYGYIPNVTHQDGSQFTELYRERVQKSTPKLPQASV